ncbi:hypothetical protein H106_06389 [Trichophyton rubrum CBS 735.88]|nr:hypothetical protein H106_06389 [Trichophyton rubrum CBS 735.88]
MVTYLERLKSPGPSYPAPVLQAFLFLADAEIDISNLRLTFTPLFKNKIIPVAVALVDAIHINKHGQTRCNVATGSEPDREWCRSGLHRNKAFNRPVSISDAIFFEWYATVSPFDMTG